VKVQYVLAAHALVCLGSRLDAALRCSRRFIYTVYLVSWSRTGSRSLRSSGRNQSSSSSYYWWLLNSDEFRGIGRIN